MNKPEKPATIYLTLFERTNHRGIESVWFGGREQKKGREGEEREREEKRGKVVGGSDTLKNNLPPLA